MAEMVKKFQVQATQITQLKKQLLGGAPDVFGKSVKVAEDSEKTVQELHAKIGQLTMETNFHDYPVVRISSYPQKVQTHIVDHPFSVHATGIG